jgi:hypothetical protein
VTLDHIKTLVALAQAVLDSDDAEAYAKGINTTASDLEGIVGADPDIITFTLADEKGEALDVSVAQAGHYLNISPDKDYDNPVSLSWFGGKLQALVNADATLDEPQAIDLTLANYSTPACCYNCGHTDRQEEFFPTDGRDDRLVCPECEGTNVLREGDEGGDS